MPEIPKQDLLDELERLAEELGQPPTLQDLREHGTYAAMTYYNRFGSWRAAMAAAGFEPREPETAVATTELLDELQRVADELGAPPTASEMNEHGEYWVSTYQNRFGSWNEAVAAAGFDPTPESSKVSREALLAELRHVADKLGKQPTYAEMNEHGDFAPATYERHFGSWSAAVEEAFN